MIEIFPLIRLSKVILVVLDLSQDGVGMSKAVSVYEFSIQVFCFTLVSYVLGNHKIVPKSSKNKVEELYTEHRNSRLPTWFCCFGCKHAAEYPKTLFFYTVKILPTLHVTVRPWDARFLRKEKNRAAQNSCNFCYLIG